MDINKLKLTPDSSIEEALKVVGKERVRLGIIVDKKDKFLGVISDSNIRKALIKGKNLQSKSKISILKILLPSKKILLNRQVNSNFVIIMAGGLGTRLKELTKDTPKPMLKVGKKPILESIVQKLKEQNFENFIFCVNYKKQIIEDYFKKGKNFGVKIFYIKERKKLGTAGALSLIKQDFKESFIVMNADILTELNFNELLKAHKDSKALMSVCVREFEQQIPFGVIEQNKGFITNITEKPVQKFLVSAGIYVCEPEMLELLNKNEYLDMPELIKLAMQKGRVNTYLIHDYWIDIGRLDEFVKANEDFK
ncbi:NTP transferase domain-containing protein [Campylobacter coli]|nr:NTP transferase domain-containing protein [Campylobacter coli]